MLVNKEQILAELVEIIRDVIDLPDLAVTMATTADKVEGWDSFIHINIVVAVETHFGIKFNTAEIEELRNVGELMDLVHKKLHARKSGGQTAEHH
jgi:acyl carrier protein